jgi:hypothetical protein
VVGSCEHGNEPSGSIKCVGFLRLGNEFFSTRTMLHGVTARPPVRQIVIDV